MKKLVQAQIPIETLEEFSKVLSAFCAPFPSLQSLPAIAGEILQYLYTGEFSENISSAIEADSYNGEWPGEVKLVGNNIRGKWIAEEIQIVPYCGDRILIVRDFRDAPVWPNALCIADYSQRPSLVAAKEVIQLATRVQLWNELEWLNDDASLMQKNIDFLEKLADVNCGCGEDENHDCNNCIYCEARRVLNDIGDIAAYAVNSAQQKMHPTKEVKPPQTLCVPKV